MSSLTDHRGAHVCAAIIAALLALASSARAQTFPEPGTGVYSWQTVGDRPVRANGLDFAPDGTLYVGSSVSTAFALMPATPDAPTGTWRTLPGSPGAGNDAVLALSRDTLLVGNYNGTGLARTTDGGQTWTDVNGCSAGCATGGPRRPGGFLVLPPGHPHAGRILAGGGIGDIGPIYSDDRGATWLVATNEGGGGAYPFDFALLPSGRVLACRSGIYATDDGGVSYTVTALGVGTSGEGVVALATPGSSQSGAPSCGQANTTLCDGAVTVGYSFGLVGMQAWSTNDGGRTWSQPVALPQPDDGIGFFRAAVVMALPSRPGSLGRAIAVLGRGIVYVTADGAQSWQAVGRLPLDLTTGSEAAWYVRLGPDGHLWVLTIRAGATPYPMYRSVEPAAAAFPVSSEAPPETGEARIRVEPNPVSGRASVRVSLKAPTEARIVVFDALGRRVAVLHDGPLGAGERTFSLDTSALPAGVYVVRAAAAEARFTVVR